MKCIRFQSSHLHEGPATFRNGRIVHKMAYIQQVGHMVPFWTVQIWLFYLCSHKLRPLNPVREKPEQEREDRVSRLDLAVCDYHSRVILTQQMIDAQRMLWFYC